LFVVALFARGAVDAVGAGKIGLRDDIKIEELPIQAAVWPPATPEDLNDQWAINEAWFEDRRGSEAWKSVT
jgi:hypothetical protein